MAYNYYTDAMLSLERNEHHRKWKDWVCGGDDVSGWVCVSGRVRVSGRDMT